MLEQLIKANRRRVPVKYAVIAAVVAALSVAALETAGKMLTSSYSGLGGKLGGGPSATAPASAPIK
jgi:Flp pilus assembly pilin Flp